MYLFKFLRSLLDSESSGSLEATTRRFRIPLHSGKHSTGINRFRNAARTPEIETRRLEVSPSHRDVGGIDICNRVIRIHTHCNVEDIAKLVRLRVKVP